jgi:low temperature requirement protein LtrA
MLVLAALWWAWSVYAWLTSAIDVDQGGVRLVMLASMGAMFGVALAVPGAFGDDAVLFGVAYLYVRLLHLVLSATATRDDPNRLGATLHHVDEALDTVSAVGLCGGAALYLLGEIAFLLRTTGRVFRRRTVGAVVLLALIPATVAIPALAALALVSAACSLVVAYEAIRYRSHRVRVRHPEVAA